ncbi:MAG: glycoside hydrolase family 11 protein [Treponema sp.]|jgi:endo-1,4-beta-xylanase|nr:glycoside hydrolase family 11 protein [Treponema sp.]
MKTKQIILFLAAMLLFWGCDSDSEEEVINDGEWSYDDSGWVFGGFSGPTVSGNKIDKYNGYDYELWNQNNKGNVSMTLGNSGTFKCSWSGIENVLFRSGKKYDRTQTHSQIGVFSVIYDAPIYSVTSGDISYLSVYGWVDNPLIEYYIVDSWGKIRPPGSWTGAVSKGQIKIDGGTYDIYETTRTNQPSINGTQTFKQYWSVRTEKRTSGAISISKHFNAWADKGMTGIKGGKMYEVALKIEGYQSSGSAEIKKNILLVNSKPIK